MRVLILHSRYLSGAASGENRVVDDEARLLAEAGHQVDVWDPAPSDTQRASPRRHGGRSDLVDRGDEPCPRPDPTVGRGDRPLPQPLPAPVAGRAAGRAQRRRRRGDDPAQLPSPLSAGHVHPRRPRVRGLPRAGRRGPASCTRAIEDRGWGAPRSPHRSPSTRRSIPSIRSTSYLAVSGFVRDKHVEGGWPGDRIDVKPNFAWTSQRREGPGRYFLYLGRLSPEKGVATLLKAWRRSSARLLIVGDGPTARALRAGSSAERRVPADGLTRGGARPDPNRRGPFCCPRSATRASLARSSRHTRPASPWSRATSAHCPRPCRATPGSWSRRATPTPGPTLSRGCSTTERASGWGRGRGSSGAIDTRPNALSRTWRTRTAGRSLRPESLRATQAVESLLRR